MKIKLNNLEYEVVKNYRDGFDKESVEEKTTEYFSEYDYIFGDWAYGKLRLKGFYKKDNKKVTKINNVENLEKYIKENCAYDCKYFLLEKK
ncbi:MAG: DUF1027 domain-containing protein [Bacilli bacterium]|nr:DUF1027 domain-containing protein [Bacilli bacterium]